MAGNPNPSPATRFSSENQPAKRGRSKGDWDRLTSKFLLELADHFELHGRTAIEKVYETDPGKYLQAVAALVPREVEITRPLADVSDEELAALIAHMRQQAKPAEDETRTVN